MMALAQHIGSSVPRRDDAALLRGDGAFFSRLARADDLRLLVIRSPLPHATIRCIDLGQALEAPGIVLGFVAADLVRNGPLPAADLTDASLPAHQSVLATDRVRYVGEPIAILVGASLDALRDAARLVRLDLLPLPAVATIADALAPGAPLLRDGLANAVHPLHHDVGAVDQAFAEAELVLDGRFRFHRVAAMPLEPRGVAAWTDAATGRLHVAAATQIPGAARDALADLLGLDRDRVAYEPVALGGGFGCKEAFYPEEGLVAEAARRLGRRVRWQETRTEHFSSTVHGRDSRVHLRMALGADGVVTALDLDGQSDIGAGYSFASNSPGAAMGAMVRGPYRIPNHRATTVSVTTNKTPLNVYRGAGHPQAVFAMERLMDRAAAATGLDRVEIRRRNLIARHAFPHDRGVSYPGAGRIVYDSGDFERCLDEAVDAIGYGDFSARRAAFERDTPHLRLGLGLAMLVELTSTGPDETVVLRACRDGMVTVDTAGVELGQRAGSALTQILSDRLSLTPDSIRIHHGQPISRSGGGSFASRGASVIGAAVADGAARLVDLALERAARQFDIAIDRLAWRDGGIVGLPGRNAPLELGELLSLTGEAEFAVIGEVSVPQSSFASACHAAVVSVDVETGTVAVLDYAVAHDCGRLLNPAGVDDQIIGGVMQGIGVTLFEEIVYDGAAMPHTSSLMDYPLPVAANVPRFHLRHVETPSPVNPLGFKGAGEGGFVGVPAALAGAIEHALSAFAVRLDDDGPYTPSRVLGLLHSPAPQPPSEST